MARLTYSRAVFDVADEAAARRIILTPEFGESTDQRWARETPYLTELIGAEIAPRRGGLYLDYGCGIGRLSKALIERFGCRVLGVDISERMRALAPDYVGAQTFSAVSPHILHALVTNGLRVDGAICVWVLQHCLAPSDELDLMRQALRPGAGLFVLNVNHRAVPTAEGRWGNDGVDVRALLAERFTEARSGRPDTSAVPEQTAAVSFWATYRA